MRRAVIRGLIGVIFMALIGSPASAQTTPPTGVEAVARALRADPVYVDANASRALTEEEARRLRDAVRSSGQPIFVAVVGEEALGAAGGSADAVARAVAQATGLAGTYAVVAGNS